MQQSQEKPDFQPNYLVPMTKLKSSELRSIWKDDFAFRHYVRKFWFLSQKTFVDSLADDLIDQGAVVDYDFTGCVPGMDGVIYFKVEPTLESIEGFIAGIEKLQKNYGLFTDIDNMMDRVLGGEDDDENDASSSFLKKLVSRKPPQIVAFESLKKAWKNFKKNKRSQLEPDLFKIVVEQLEKMEHYFKSFVCCAFDWISDDSRQLEMLEEFVQQFKETLWYDMLNKRFMEIVDISNRKI